MGLTLTGEFIEVERHTYKVRNGQDAGQERETGRVKLLVGSGAMTVEYKSYEEAFAAVATSDGALPERMTVLSVPVFAQGPWDDRAGRRGLVRLSGRVSR